jgi:signal transduction histidine kinase
MITLRGPHSLRVKITAVAAAVIVLAVTAVGFALVGTVKHHLVRQVDHELTGRMTYYRQLLQRHPDTPLPARVTSDLIGETLAPDGTIVSRSKRVVGLPPLTTHLPAGAAPVFSTIQNSRFGHLRVIAQRVSTTDRRVAVDAEQIDQIIAAQKSLTVRVLIALPLLAVVLILLVWTVLNRALNRVDKMRTTVADISDRNLNERLIVTGSDDEIARLATTMNQMLDRLQASAQRQKQFIADASHELRTPMAALRAALETTRRDQEGLRESHEVALRALHRLDSLAESLLALDSLGDSCIDHRTAIDLDDVALAVVQHLSSISPIELDVSEISGGQVLAREIDMVRIVENLCTNAVRHATSRVALSVRESRGTVRFTASDDGSGIPAEAHKRVFERFVRVDDDRGRPNGGAGLGLAIVTDIVQQYGGHVWVEDVDPHGARFIVELPAIHAHPAAADEAGAEETTSDRGLVGRARD